VINDGTVKTGANRVKTLTLDYTYDANYDVTITGSGVSSPGFTVATQDVDSSLLKALNDARANLQLYKIWNTATNNWVNPDLVTFYENEIDRIEQEMLAEGLATLESDGTILPIRQQAVTVTVDATTAQAGRTRVLTDQLVGSGTFDAPRDAEIEIINNTPAFLIINGLEIPEVNGGLFFNGIEVTADTAPNTLIEAENQVSVDKDNNHPDIAGVPEVTLIVPTLQFTAETLAASGGVPEITIQNTLNVREGTTAIVPWPDITINGPVLNLRGNLTINNLPAAGATGDVVINARSMP